MEEALEVVDTDVTDISEKLKHTAGTKVVVKWVDPRRAAKRGRKAEQPWAAGCCWLAVRVGEVTKLMHKRRGHRRGRDSS